MRGYVVEMIRADFWAGQKRRLKHLGQPGFDAHTNLIFAPELSATRVVSADPECLIKSIVQNIRDLDWTGRPIGRFAKKCSSMMAGETNASAVPRIPRLILWGRAACSGAMWKKTSSPTLWP